jgi:hypothetical protein
MQIIQFTDVGFVQIATVKFEIEMIPRICDSNFIVSKYNRLFDTASYNERKYN